MGEPTIAKRLERRFMLLTSDSAIEARLRAEVPQGWEMVGAQHLNVVKR